MIIDLGCGKNKKRGSVGVDNVKLPGVDIVSDLNKRFPFEDNSVDGIYASHILEHLNDFVFAMSEIWRIAKPGAWVKIWVPHFSSKTTTWGDPTHKRPLGLVSFECFLPERDIHYIKPKFQIEEVRLNFTLDPNVKPKNLKQLIYLKVGRIAEKIVNRSISAQKRYEMLWCNLFPFSELYIKLKVVK